MVKLIMFYGTECIHCHEMMPLVEKLEKELKVKVEKLEVWHNSDNRNFLDKCNKVIRCTGVPFFYNEKTKKGICGAVPYDELKVWALGK